MQAEYTSKCAACGGWIEPGDDIVRSPDTGDWVHEECEDEA